MDKTLLIFVVFIMYNIVNIFNRDNWVTRPILLRLLILQHYVDNYSSREELSNEQLNQIYVSIGIIIACIVFFILISIFKLTLMVLVIKSTKNIVVTWLLGLSIALYIVRMIRWVGRINSLTIMEFCGLLDIPNRLFLLQTIINLIFLIYSLVYLF